MPALSQAEEIRRIGAELQAPTLVYISRRVLLHERNPTGTPCPCCGSARATVVDERQHIDLLIDAETGARRLRSQVADPDAFDRIAAEAVRVEMPLRCTRLQLDVVLDHRTKVMGLFGGERGGKTSTMKEAVADRVLLLGGPGRSFWWVAPSQAKTQIGVSMLAKGLSTDRWVPPVFPPSLVLSYPEHERAADQRIRLIDGTTIELKYACRKGGNLKGDPAVAVFLDEGCEVPHELNWTILVGRTTDFGGQLIVATTPVAGHWLREKVHQAGLSHEAARLVTDRRVEITSDNFSSFDNPWMDPAEIERSIVARGGREDPRVQREVFGLWVGEGPTLWRHFAERPDPQTGICHLRSGLRDVADHGLVNVTPEYVARLFPWAEGLASDKIGGHDFNLWPMSTVIAQVGVPRGCDPSIPRNRVLWITDEVVKRGTVFDHAKFLAEGGAARRRRLDPSYFVGMPIVCDGTGLQPTAPAGHSLHTSSATSLGQALEQYGFPVRPPTYSRNGNPANPSKIDAVSLMHKLMVEQTDPDVDGIRWPRFIVNPERCDRTVHALKTQEADDRGRPLKVSGNASDRLSGPTDAVSYLAWSLFSDEYQPVAIGNW